MSKSKLAILERLVAEAKKIDAACRAYTRMGNAVAAKLMAEYADEKWAKAAAYEARWIK